jgi:hypothetical protein
MSQGVRKFLKRVPVKAQTLDGDEKIIALCEIPDCESRYVPGTNGFPDRRECGRADVTVNDYGGVKRGICGEHYIRGLVKAGKHPNQALMNSDGSMSPVLVKEHWAKLDAEAKP